MRSSKQGSRASAGGRRGAFRPRSERLEDRTLLAVTTNLDLGGAAPPTLPNIATNNVGVDLGAATPNGGAGFSVADAGDLAGTGFDDFLIGAPTLGNTLSGSNIATAGSGTGSVYLVLGSQQVNATTATNWLTLTPQQRVGDLGQLGAATQTNPVSGQANTAPFAGITFTASVGGAGLGASVAVAQNTAAGTVLVLGAPSAPGTNGASNGGRVYVVEIPATTLKTLATTGTNTPINLDSPAAGITVVTFTDQTAGANAGYSVAGPGDLTTDGAGDILIGAPHDSVAGNTNDGAVYLISGAALPLTTTTVPLSTVGQTGGISGAIFTGTSATTTTSLDEIGYDVAGVGDVNGALVGIGTVVPDFVIGAPALNKPAAQAGSGGAAYLIYGGSNLLTLATVRNGVNYISLSSVGTLGSSGVSGAVFDGLTAGSATGFSVSGAGDFNADGFADFMIGSPGIGTIGRVDLIYGQGVGNQLQGTYNLATPPSSLLSATFTSQTGTNVGSPQTGYAVSQLGLNIAIGAPGLNNGQGAVYIIPPRSSGTTTPALTGTFSLNAATAQPLAATVVTLSNSLTAVPFFGASLANLGVTSAAHTVDGDNIPDLLIGAPGYGVAANRAGAGGAFVVQMANVTLQTPVNNVITTQIGVGAATSSTGTFSVNATSPAALQIFVFSNAASNFHPVTDINLANVSINGVSASSTAFTSVTLAQDPVDENKDGIPDAIITVVPRSALGLVVTNTTFTIQGLTSAAAADPNVLWTGTANISVAGSAFPPTGTVTGQTNLTTVVTPSTLQTPFGAGNFVPTVAAASAYNYQPIPLQVAYSQYLPTRPFRQRILQFTFPRQAAHQFGKDPNEESHINHNGIQDLLVGGNARQVKTLDFNVFTRSPIAANKSYTFTHKLRVIPIQDQTQTIRG